VNRSIRHALMESSEDDIRLALQTNGVKTLTDQALARVADGSMSVAEAYRTCYFGGGGTDA